MTWSQGFGRFSRTPVVTRGDTRRYRVTAWLPHPVGADKDGPPPVLDLTGWSVRSTWKLKRPDGFTIYQDKSVIALSSDNTDEIVILDQTAEDKGRLTIHLSSSMTKFMNVGVYRYDVVLQSPTGDIITVINDEVIIRDTATSAEDQTSP